MTLRAFTGRAPPRGDYSSTFMFDIMNSAEFIGRYLFQLNTRWMRANDHLLAIPMFHHLF